MKEARHISRRGSVMPLAIAVGITATVAVGAFAMSLGGGLVALILCSAMFPGDCDATEFEG
jgi:hypothetical protein